MKIREFGLAEPKKEGTREAFDADTLKFKATHRYSHGWVDPKAVFGTAQADRRAMPRPTTDELNNHEAFNTPLNTLENLWIAKYGYSFVTAEALEEDRFFDIACYRLSHVGRLDVHEIDGYWHMRVPPESSK